MIDDNWWKEHPQLRLSQGDIISGLPVFSVPAPLPLLGKQTLKQDKVAWVSVPHSKNMSQPLHALATGKITSAVVLSHSCELDKERSGARVLVAPVAPLSSMKDPDFVESVLQQKVYAAMPLPDVPGLGHCAADLRLIVNLPRDFLNDGVRVASMTDAALQRLAAQLVGFFFRLQLPREAAETIRVQES